MTIADKAFTTALCFVVDDEPAVGRLISHAVGECGISVEQFIDAGSMNAALRDRMPGLVFLDVSLGAALAIAAIRCLSAENCPAAVQLMSDLDDPLVADVRMIGDRHDLRMLPPLAKPLSAESVRRIADAELVSPAHAV